MAALNMVQIIGNVGKKPEIKTITSGMQVANFSVAVTTKSKGEDLTEWFSVVAFDKLAGLVQMYVGKGSPIYVQGRLKTDKWEDSEGATRYAVRVIAEMIQLLGGKGKEESLQERIEEKVPKLEAKGRVKVDFDDDVPF
jgi:single-strand DNA-binding protein